MKFVDAIPLVLVSPSLLGQALRDWREPIMSPQQEIQGSFRDMNDNELGTVLEEKTIPDQSVARKSTKASWLVAVMAMDSESAINAARKLGAVLPRPARTRLQFAVEDFFTTRKSEVSAQRTWS